MDPGRTNGAARWLVSMALLGVSACGGAAPAPPAPPRPPAEPTPAAVEPPPAEAGLDPVPGALCQGRAGCRVVETQAAGKDAGGRALSVIELALGAPADAGRAPDACQHVEYWLVARGGGAALHTERLLELCNDGYGASGIGEDEVRVEPNRFSHAQVGGSSWRWQSRVVLQLSPLEVLTSEDSSWWNVAAHFSSSSWSWETLAGRTAWFIPACDAKGEWTDPPLDGVTVGGDLDDPPGYAFAYDVIPAFELDEAYVRSAWQTTPIDACALRVDGGPRRGFVLDGGPGSADDASMSVLASRDGTLFVELRADRRLLPGATRRDDDRLEVWLGRAPLPAFGAHCVPPVTARPRRWTIRAVDGAVLAGAGQPSPRDLRVERAEATDAGGQRAVRLKIALPRETSTITLVHSVGGDGQRPRRRIATSKLRPGEAWSLGTLLTVAPDQATCKLEGGRLTPHLTPGSGRRPNPG